MAVQANMTWHHGGINVTDVNRSIRWYRDVLGFKYVARDELMDDHGGFTVAWMEYKGFYLELFEKPKGVKLDEDMENDSIGTRHLCLSVSPEDFTALHSYFLEHGVPVVNEFNHPQSEVGKPGGLRCMFILDPDGIRIEFLEDFLPGSYGTNLPTEV